jgi:hypothetical protein
VRDAFLQLRDAIADNTPLRLVNPNVPVHARADASAVAAGGQIGQYNQWTGAWEPLGYFHHTFTAVQRRYSTNVREFLALALLILRFGGLLRDCRVIGWVDHSNLLYLSKSENPRLLRIALLLRGAGFDPALAYEPGVRCQLPDTLSRCTLERSVSAPAGVTPDLAAVALVVAMAAQDTAATPEPPIVSHAPPSGPAPAAALPAGWTSLDQAAPPLVAGLPANTHSLVHAVVRAQQSMSAAARKAFLQREHAAEKRLGDVPTLYVSSRLFVPPQAVAEQRAYLAAVHEPVHVSTPADMVERLRDRVKVYWDSMMADAERYYKSCGRCQHVAAGTRPSAVGRMSPFLYPVPNHTLLVDFFGPLDSCERASPLDPTGAKHEYKYIITLVDGYSRFALFLPSTHKSAAAATAAFRHWCTFYGPPRVVRTDSDLAFSAETFQDVLREYGSVHDPVPPYTHHQMGLLERAHKPLADALRKLGGHASSEWVDFIAVVAAWRNSSVNRDLGVCPYEALFCRKPTFAYDRLGAADMSSVTPNELANVSAALDVCVRTAVAVSAAQVTAQYDSARAAPPVYRPDDTVLVYFPDRENKCHTYYRGPFVVLAAQGDSGNYYRVRDLVQLNEYVVHVERLKPFDMSRTSVLEQAARQLPSRDFGIVVAVDGHRMNEAHGLLEFCIRFYSGYRAWQLFTSVAKLDVVKQYVAEHKLDTRRRTPAQQLRRLTGQAASDAPARPAPARKPSAAASSAAAPAAVPAPAAAAAAAAPTQQPPQAAVGESPARDTRPPAAATGSRRRSARTRT